MTEVYKMVKTKNKKTIKKDCLEHNVEYYEQQLLKKRAKHIYSALKMYLSHRMTMDQFSD